MRACYTIGILLMVYSLVLHYNYLMLFTLDKLREGKE